MKEQGGKVWLAGAGPGDAELLTVKVKRLMEEAQVIVYDALISAEILCQLPESAELIHVGKRSGHHLIPQEEINEILLREAKKGKKVLRLKGGDPFIFGRGGEELELLKKHHIPFEVVPGVTSVSAVPAYGGIPLTHRDFTSSFHVITGHQRKGKEEQIDYVSLVKLEGTLVFLMGMTAMDGILKGLMEAGMGKDTPAAVLENGTLAAQRSVVSTVDKLSDKVKKAGIGTPAIILVGQVCALSKSFSWVRERVLGGRQILITRPSHNTSKLAIRLRELGAQVIELPAIVTKPIVPNRAFEQAIERFGTRAQEEWLVFTSPAGVTTFFDQMGKQGRDIRDLFTRKAKIKIAVIGSATKDMLGTFGLQADLQPQVYCTSALGRELAKEANPGSSITVLRAKEGSQELLSCLEKERLFVEDIPLYETFYKTHEPVREKIGELFAAGGIDAVTFTSASTVRGFVQAMGALDYSGIKAVCIGEQTALQAAQYGMELHVSAQASIDSMTELIIQLLGNKIW